MASADRSDEDIVLLVLGGEREEFATLVDRYKRPLANFIGAGVHEPATVADLSQDTFLRAYAHLGSFNPALGKFSTWIYHIARNVVRTHFGKTQRRPATRDLGDERTLEARLADDSPGADPSTNVEREEAGRELRSALRLLPERTRTVLALRYFSNMDYNAIAQTMGLSLGNVKTLIHRGKIRLAQKMRERGVEDHALPVV